MRREAGNELAGLEGVAYLADPTAGGREVWQVAGKITSVQHTIASPGLEEKYEPRVKGKVQQFIGTPAFDYTSILSLGFPSTHVSQRPDNSTRTGESITQPATHFYTSTSCVFFILSQAFVFEVLYFFLCVRRTCGLRN